MHCVVTKYSTPRLTWARFLPKLLSMTAKPPGVHVVTTTRAYKGKTYRSHLLRRSYREDGEVKKETLANLTPLCDQVVEFIRRGLRGEQLVSVDEVFQVVENGSPRHGGVEAVLLAMKRLGFERLIASRPSRREHARQGRVR